ncbi:hypothetical protein F4553_001681 [Allocatelliglobosispora scoriae]|uniref:TIR domain-containing protein n=1 Tax=Allocatelliglobosispora scoriae TaxID=643052 RepID=A0A841BNI4_9ACTN|nr:toll/interleukin-1 receptor domain-containing protein [Allocatelliglobosispora scoriae]MBB5868302.1 hypothetical protein [Allocatelliglobosispora scoriae]
MTGYVFISYGHADDAGYVARLATHLRSAGVPAWFDAEIRSGNVWESVIRERLDSCAAFVVVMTPAAESSPWVSREINRAEKLRKPIFPLLLAGEEFFRLSNIQYEDVSGGRLPSAGYVRLLTGAIQPSAAERPSTPIAEGDRAQPARQAAAGDETLLMTLVLRLEQAGKDDEAIALLKRNVEAGGTDMLMTLVLRLEKAGRKSEAIAYLQRHVDAGGTDMLMTLVQRLEQAGKKSEAIAYLQRHVEAGSTDMLMTLVQRLEQAGKKGEAIAYLQRNVEAGGTDMLMTLVLRLESAGRDEEALAYLRRHVEAGGTDMLMTLILRLEKAGKQDEAIALLQRHAAG